MKTVKLLAMMAMALESCCVPGMAFASKEAETNLVISGGSTEFVAIGKPAMIRIKGEGPGPQGSLSISKGTVSGNLSLDLDGMTTGIELRDTHMKEKYLETKRYPKADFVISKCQVHFDGTNKSSEKDVPFAGVLHLHGVENPVEGKLDLEKNGTDLRGIARFSFPLSEFKIAVPSYAGITVSDHVDVTVNLKLISK